MTLKNEVLPNKEKDFYIRSIIMRPFIRSHGVKLFKE